jgi:hypothetical protein
MKKIILTICLLVIATGFGISQDKKGVGINTDHPQGIFHIDAKKDNGNISIPLNTSDDVVFKPGKNELLNPFSKFYGHLGVGKVNPDVGLDVNGNIRLQDGTEAQDKILVSTDSLGNAKWIAPEKPEISTGIIGDSIHLRLDEGPTNLTQEPLQLRPGRWLVLSKFVVRNSADPGPAFRPRNNILIYLKNITEHPNLDDKVYNTILGVPVEQAGFFIGTPQLAAVVEVPEIDEKGEKVEFQKFEIHGSTSNVQYKYITTNKYFQGAYFYAVRLDSGLID